MLASSLDQILVLVSTLLILTNFKLVKSQNDDVIDCYQCETDVFESVEDMKKDNCYTLVGLNPDQKCSTQQNVCSASEFTKQNLDDPINQ